MSDLQPKGIPVKLLDEKERHLLFTLACVDEVQDYYDLPVNMVMAKLADEREGPGTLAVLVQILINDEIKRNGGKDLMTLEQVKWQIDVPSEPYVMRAVMQSYGYSLPEQDEEDPN